MAYWIPMKYKCPRCEFVSSFSQSVNHKAPVSQEGEPYCPRCFDELIGRLVPKMENTGERSETY